MSAKVGANFADKRRSLGILRSQTKATLLLLLDYFPGVARVFIYPNLIVICLPSLAEIAHLDGCSQ
jgi:hypothetical protein